MKIPNVKPENISHSNSLISRGFSKTAQKTNPQDNFIAQKENMIRALKEQAEIREDVVAKGKLLASDPDYPSMERVGDLAQLFANQNYTG